MLAHLCFHVLLLLHCFGSSGPQELCNLKIECALVHEAVQQKSTNLVFFPYQEGCDVRQCFSSGVTSSNT